jgi:hypothetical protein
MLRTIATFAAVCLASALVSAQRRPDLSGQWVPVGPAADAGQVLVIKQTDALLTVEDAEHTVRYRLDGTESANAQVPEVQVMSRAVWKQSSLVVTNTFSVQGTVRSVQEQVWSLDAQGRLVIEVIRRAGTRPPEITKILYTRR